MSRTFLPHVITDDSALGGAVIERSLRFNKADSAYLSRTPSAQGDRRVFTLSWWMKLGQAGVKANTTTIFSAQRNTLNPDFQINLYEHALIIMGNKDGNSSSYMISLITEQFFRDPNAWYHCVVAFNTNDGTASNRIKIYVNGSQVTNFAAGGTGLAYDTYPSSGDQTAWGTNEATQNIGRRYDGDKYFDGYLAEINYVDGSQLDASHFGYTESQTGLWRPKRYTGGYGDVNNGFHLEFKDNSSTSALGKDTSGNGNDFTTNNFSVSAGAGNDSLEDTPTNNFPTLNPLNINPYSTSGYPSPTFTNGNLTFTTNTTSQVNYAESSMYFPESGKWYIETTVSNLNIGSGVGYAQITVNGDTGGSRYLWWHYASSYYEINTDSGLQTIGSISNGDIIQVAYDADTSNLWFGKNNSWYLSGDPSSATPMSSATTVVSDNTKFYVAGRSGSATNIVDVNFGQRPFNYTPPTGFKALCSKNLPPNAPSIIRPQKHFDTLLYTGNGTSQRISGLEFAPDIVWIKARTGASNRNHNLFDTIRVFAGDGTKERIYPNLTNEGQSSIWSSKTNLTDFHHDGFSVGAGTDTNTNTYTYVAWCWKAGGAAVSNSDGTITSQVSANTEAGFSIVSYTGNGANNATVGHGLGKSPDWVIVKDRDTNSAGNNWYVFHSALTSGHYVKLNQNSDTAALSGTSNGGVGSVTSTTFNFVQGTSGNNKNVNESGDNFIAYCWTEIPGYSKFGSYSGNSSTDGTYVHLGFRPAWVMVKRYDGSGQGWNIFDNTRNTFNLVDEFLIANSSNAEATGSALNLDFLSNGIKFRGSDGGSNTSGSDYIYMVFAEQPGTTSFETFPNSR